MEGGGERRGRGVRGKVRGGEGKRGGKVCRGRWREREGREKGVVIHYTYITERSVK